MRFKIGFSFSDLYQKIIQNFSKCQIQRNQLLDLSQPGSSCTDLQPVLLVDRFYWIVYVQICLFMILIHDIRVLDFEIGLLTFQVFDPCIDPKWVKSFKNPYERPTYFQLKGTLRMKCQLKVTLFSPQLFFMSEFYSRFCCKFTILSVSLGSILFYPKILHQERLGPYSSILIFYIRNACIHLKNRWL